jgi:hypothetical protein
MPVIAILNAIVRELLFVKNYGEKAAHQLSTITLIILLGIYVMIILGKYRIVSFSQAVWTGVLWCLLTLTFEFSLGFFSGATLDEMLRAYDLFSGQLWVLVPFFILIAPVLHYSAYRRVL